MSNLIDDEIANYLFDLKALLALKGPRRKNVTINPIAARWLIDKTTELLLTLRNKNKVLESKQTSSQQFNNMDEEDDG